MRRLIVIAAAVPLLFGLRSTHAQSSQSRPSPWSLEINGDAAFPTRTIAGADLQTGWGIGFTARYRLQSRLAAYAGWEWHMQQTEELIAGQTLAVNDNGYTLGLRFEHPLFARAAGWARAGALIDHIEVEDHNGNTVDNSGHGLGWEGGVGLTFPLDDHVGLMPNVRYRTLSRDVTVSGVTHSAALSYVTAGIGIAITF